MYMPILYGTGDLIAEDYRGGGVGGRGVINTTSSA